MVFLKIKVCSLGEKKEKAWGYDFILTEVFQDKNW